MRILSREPVHLEIPEGRYIVYITTLLVQLAFTVLLFGGSESHCCFAAPVPTYCSYARFTAQNP